MSKVKKYLINVFIAVDQLANALLLGDPDETISSRAGKALERKGWSIAEPLCYLLSLVDFNHCKDAIEEDEGKDALMD